MTRMKNKTFKSALTDVGEAVRNIGVALNGYTTDNIERGKKLKRFIMTFLSGLHTVLRALILILVLTISVVLAIAVTIWAFKIMLGETVLLVYLLFGALSLFLMALTYKFL